MGQSLGCLLRTEEDQLIHRKPVVLGALAAAWMLLACVSAAASEFETAAPRVVLTHVAFDVTVGGLDEGVAAVLLVNGNEVARSAGDRLQATGVVIEGAGRAVMEVRYGGVSEVVADVPVIAGWLSVLPPLIAILLAFALRSVIPALFVGMLMGAWAINGLTLQGAFHGFFETVSIYIVDTATDRDHMTIMVFTFLIGGMIGIISRNGGMLGIVQRIMPFAHTPKRGQGIIATLGLAIFFDD